MPHTDTSEKGLEALIVESFVGDAGYTRGDPKDFDREHALDWPKLLAFLQATQPKEVERLDLASDSPNRARFLARLTGEITKRGIVEVLRKGVSEGPVSVTLFYGSPSRANAYAVARFAHNTFSVTRQLRYSRDETALSLDLCLMVNGLPVATFELKNRLTKQTVEDAVQQYKRDRDPRERLFEFGRCLVHFAVDDQEVRFCTSLKGKDSWFLPFNKGWDDGAGNPPNPRGLKTDYLWKEILTKVGLTDILENYAQVVETRDEQTGRKKQDQIFPRYHQLGVVRRLLADVAARGSGQRYLIQHSAGSGKSNSIAWLAHQLVGLERQEKPIFDSVIVVTDRKVLDRQIQGTVKRFAQVASIVGHAGGAGDLRRFIQDGKKIIITTVQKFPFVLAEIGEEHRKNTFGIIIDEAHSSQGGRTAAKMNMALSDQGRAGEDDGAEDEPTVEDQINRLMEGRRMLKNASYFAFTATPKNKTLQVFGEGYDDGGVVKHRPFHAYTMKQAIQEQFILDVLAHYTTVLSYYRLMKKIEDDPEFDTKKAGKKLRRYVEGHEHAIRQKAEIMLDHFIGQVYGKQKIGGQARAMVITGSIERAIDYFHAFNASLAERRSPLKAIVAFSGEHEHKVGGGAKVTEASLNGFASSKIVDVIQEEPYRFLICADKFQTGYDEPLLHTMYVDKILSGIKAVQTLSRLNRAHPKKHDTFVLDFANDARIIQTSFEDFYRTTLLSAETDPNKLHDLKADLDGAQVYSDAAIKVLVTKYLADAPRDQLDAILDPCVATYLASLDEDGQVKFKGDAKAFIRSYGFLGAVLPYNIAAWEKLSIFLNFLVPKLPAPKEDDLSKGILQSIDMDSYRAEAKSTIALALTDANAEVEPVPTSSGGFKPEPELDKLSNIVWSFNEQFGNIEWNDADRIRRVIAELPATVSADKAYQNAMANSDKQNARIEHDAALHRAMLALVADHTDLFRRFSDDPSFKSWLAAANFAATYYPGGRGQAAG